MFASLVVSMLLLGQAPSEQTLVVALAPVNDEVPGHAPAQLQALLASAFADAEWQDEVRLAAPEVAQVLLAPTLWLGPKGEVSVRWVLTPRLRPQLERRVGFVFSELANPAQLGPAQAQAMVGPLLEAAQALLLKAQRAAAGELPVAPPQTWEPRRERPRTVTLRGRASLLLPLDLLLPLALEFQGAVHSRVSLFVAPELLVLPGFGAGAGLELGVRAFPLGTAPRGFSVGLSVTGQLLPTRRDSWLFPFTVHGTLGYARVWSNGLTAAIFVGGGYALLLPTSVGRAVLSASASLGYAF